MYQTQNPPFYNGGPGNLWPTYHLGWKIHATNFGSQLRELKSSLFFENLIRHISI